MINCIKKFFNTNIFFLIVLTVVVFCVYGKSINYELINLDENTLIIKNINYISDISNIPKFFLGGCFYSEDSTYYRPILTISFSIESILFGLNSKVYHITNIILFILNLYLLYIFLLKINLNKNITKLILILFAIYPVISSCCVWVTARNDSLLSIFIILTFINIINYLTTKKTLYLLFLLIFFTLSIFTKETALIFLLIYPLFIYLFKYNISKKQIISLVLGCTFILVIYFIMRHFAVEQIKLSWYIKDSYVLLKNIINGLYVYIYTILTPFYVPIAYLNDDIDVFKNFIVFLFIILLAIIYYKKIIRRNILFLGLSIFVFGLIPTFFNMEKIIYFHRLLLPLSGIIIILIELFNQLINKKESLKKYFIILFVFLFVLFSFLSFKNIDKYQNNKTFFTNGYLDVPKYHVFVNAIAKFYIEYEKYDKALELLYLADKYEPNNYINDIAVVLCCQGKIDEAEKLLNKSIAADKDKDVAYANLSLIYRDKNDYKTALSYAIKAYEENPYNIDNVINLAQFYRLNNEFDKAIELYNDLIKFDKNNPVYYYSLGVLYNDLNDKNSAINFLEKACAIDKNNNLYLQKLEEIKKY